MDRLEGRRSSVLLASLLIGVAFLGALVIDRFLVPPSYIVTSFYAIPILLAARHFCPRMVAGIGLLAVILDLLSVYLDQTPLSGWLFGLFSLPLITYLALLLARQRQEVAQYARAAQQARHQLQQFLGLVSHDLAQPLTAIQGYAQLLSRQTTSLQPERQQRAQDGIQAAIRQMDRLIGDLKDAAHIGSGHFTIQPDQLDLVLLLCAVITEQQANTSQHQLILDAPERVLGAWDQGRLYQLFTNLITNAIKYSPDGGDVCIRVQQTGQEALVSVADQGIGMTPEQCVMLFQPFARLDQADGVPGSGLGLYISKAIIEAHGGRIWVESTAGQGSVFSVALSLTKVEQAGASGAPASEAGSKRTTP
jgi:signal transduction histidine kinase